MTQAAATPKPVDVVLVATDFSELGDIALSQALQFAAERGLSSLHVVHVAAGLGPLLKVDLPDNVHTVSAEQALDLLRRLADEVRAQHVPEFEADKVHYYVRVGTPSTEVIRLADELSADLIVVGTHGRTGVRRLLLGSVAEAVVRHAKCPVLVARVKDYSSEERA
ncbi:MAG TPA: universal stress protein [Polyangiaceae bacterium]|nr:universal stress protein [Polyangiaceae bacterium]